MVYDKLLVGTAKGLINFQISEGKLIEKELYFEGLDITAIHQHFDGSTFIAISHKHWGEKIFVKNFNSEIWDELNTPIFEKTLKNVNGSPAVLKQIWDIKDGGEQYPDRLWVGTEPGALFLSEDRGITYKLVESLWYHPTRIKDKHWFGAGKELPFVHSIIIEPGKNDVIYISVSCAGIFKSIDSGKTWETCNYGMKAEYLPNTSPNAGYDPHLMLMSEVDHKVLWQQNHCGIFRSENGGKEWKDVSGENAFPSYGFCIAIEELATNEAWVIPVQDEASRIPTSLQLRVFKTSDAGKTWQNQSNGLPSNRFYGIVLRNGFVKKGNNMAFGTTNGNLYYSNNRGEKWTEVNTSMAKINFLNFNR